MTISLPITKTIKLTFDKIEITRCEEFQYISADIYYAGQEWLDPNATEIPGQVYYNVDYYTNLENRDIAILLRVGKINILGFDVKLTTIDYDKISGYGSKEMFEHILKKGNSVNGE